jgi:hypothetical protein
MRHPHSYYIQNGHCPVQQFTVTWAIGGSVQGCIKPPPAIPHAPNVIGNPGTAILPVDDQAGDGGPFCQACTASVDGIVEAEGQARLQNHAGECQLHARD